MKLWFGVKVQKTGPFAFLEKALALKRSGFAHQSEVNVGPRRAEGLLARQSLEFAEGETVAGRLLTAAARRPAHDRELNLVGLFAIKIGDPFPRKFFLRGGGRGRVIFGGINKTGARYRHGEKGKNEQANKNKANEKLRLMPFFLNRVHNLISVVSSLTGHLCLYLCL